MNISRLHVRCFFCFIYLTSWGECYSESFNKDRKIDSSYGRLIVEKLNNGSNEFSVTTARKEIKNVVKDRMFNQYFRNISQPIQINKDGKKISTVLNFSDRDIVTDGYRNVTYTFYGRGIYFWNLGIKTKIKMRVRFYLLKDMKSRQLSRPETLKEFAFLEIKVKNPTPSLVGSVSKFRAKIRNEDIFSLFSLNLKDEQFENKLATIEANTVRYNARDELKIKNMFAVMKEMTQVADDFMKPKIAVSYERTAKKLNEELYVIKRSLYKKEVLKNIEYQLTIDKNIRGYIPSQYRLMEDKNFQRYFNHTRKDYYYIYPRGIVAIELKIPIQVDRLNKKYKSPIHRHLEDNFMNVLFSEKNTVESFRLNKGKFGHLKRKKDLINLAKDQSQ